MLQYVTIKLKNDSLTLILWGMLTDVKEQFFLHCFGQKELFSQFLLQCYFFRGTVPLFLSNIGGTVPLSLSKIGGTVPLFLVRLG